MDVAPGSEMIGAIEASEDLGIPIALIDRDISITLQRALNKMGFMEKAKFMFSLIASAFGYGDDEEVDVEELKNPENLDELMEMFKDEAPSVHEVLVHERDAYLAGSIMRIPQDHVIAVVGAGHKPGIEKYLDNPETLPNLRDLEVIKDKKGIPWTKIILALIPILFVVIFFLAYFSGINITWNIYEFVVISMIMRSVAQQHFQNTSCSHRYQPWSQHSNLGDFAFQSFHTIIHENIWRIIINFK